MSLRAFHILFILASLACLGFLGFWSGRRALAGEDGRNVALAAVSGLGLLAGVPYLGWFVRKTKSPGS